jgi:hypothetical protein
MKLDKALNVPASKRGLMKLALLAVIALAPGLCAWLRAGGKASEEDLDRRVDKIETSNDEWRKSVDRRLDEIGSDVRDVRNAMLNRRADGTH